MSYNVQGKGASILEINAAQRYTVGERYGVCGIAKYFDETETLITSTSRSRQGVSIAPDGLSLVASVESGGSLYQYTRASTSSAWGSETLITSTARGWSGVSIAPDGLSLVACVYSGNLYQYTRASTSSAWGSETLITSTSRSWYGVSIAPDGLSLVASVSGGNLYQYTPIGISIGTVISNTGSQVKVLLTKSISAKSSNLIPGTVTKNRFGKTTNIVVGTDTVVEVE